MAWIVELKRNDWFLQMLTFAMYGVDGLQLILTGGDVEYTGSRKTMASH
jgi:hypothetical protein